MSRESVALHASDGRELALTVEVADEAAEWEQGLMHRTSLDANSGMLFVFDRPHILAFWMKNTPIPLDILFFDSEGRFLAANTMLPCSADPCTITSSDQPALYALEVRAGFAEQHRIEMGWRMERR